jgi:long-chain fatty acid transport protein
MNLKSKLVALAVAGAFAPVAAYATNGYAPHGVGVKSQGMAGVGVALAQDSLAAGANPAGMALVGDRLDVGVSWFRPDREAEICNNGGLNPSGCVSFDGNGKQDFFIPEFGYNKMLNPNLAVGVSVFGNGGMNTQYDSGIPLFANPLAFGQQKAGVDLMQLFIAPTVAFKVTPQHSIGASVNIIYQRFKAEGLQNFTLPGAALGLPFDPSSSPDNVTNRGYDDAWGWSVRLGWVGEIVPGFSLGATYQSKGRMGEFDKYKGLFAEQGDFDIPENFGLGFAWKPMPALTVAGDIQRISYSEVKAIGNPIAKFFEGNQLGSENGPGFGWDDMTIYKLGVAYDVTPAVTLRAGYSWGDQPIQASETFFNILAPGVIEQHLALGATWRIDPKSELSFSYMHAFEEEVKGSNSIPALFGGGEANIKMSQDLLGVAFGMKF